MNYWAIYFAGILVLGSIGFLAKHSEQQSTDHQHADYCITVAAYHYSKSHGGPIIGRRDDTGTCTTEDLQKAREALSYE